MKFDIYVAGAAKDEDLVSAKGGAGIVLVVVDDAKRIQRREMAFALGGSGQLLSDIQAARLALASISPIYRLHQTTLYTYSPALAAIITGDQTGNYQAQVAELWRWANYYKSLSVEVIADGDETLGKAQSLAERAMSDQVNFDSRTF